MRTLEDVFGGYEFHANVVGDRGVIKLTAKQAAEVTRAWLAEVLADQTVIEAAARAGHADLAAHLVVESFDALDADDRNQSREHYAIVLAAVVRVLQEDDGDTFSVSPEGAK